MEEDIYANNNQKTVGVVIILLDKIDFMQKRLQETMDLIKGSIHLKDITIINIIHNRAPKHIKQKLTEGRKKQFYNNSWVFQSSIFNIG